MNKQNTLPKFNNTMPHKLYNYICKNKISFCTLYFYQSSAKTSNNNKKFKKNNKTYINKKTKVDDENEEDT